ncbi:hypothetical protein D5086_009710 [Populus alba]|uniref:Uncharacterized protein n=1 Tax=Populus alba TaxID=43335 RepID=A0ACC4C8K2_POPAL
MLQCIFLLSDSGEVMLEKQLTGHRVDRSICAWFWDQIVSQGDSFKQQPVIASPTHYLFQIVREGITFLACTQVEMPPLMGIEFLCRVADVLSDYLEGLNEDVIKDNFVIVYELLDEMIDNGFPLTTEPNILREMIGTSILATDLLKSCFEKGLISQARNLFDEMPERDVVAWTAMISGYTHCNEYTQAWSVFVDMVKNDNAPLNAFTISSVLKACKGMNSVSCGGLVHGLAIKRRFLEGFIYVDNALMDMYAPCGVTMRAACVFFHDIKEKNVVSWTTLIAGYTHRGNGSRAVQVFREMSLMVRSGIRPDQVVFMAVLHACSHAGLVDQGLRYFNCMLDDYHFKPNQEIYGCVVGLLGRAGRVEEAYHLIRSMPFMADESVWGALLGACKAHNLSKLGKLAAKKALALKPNMVETYVMLSNIYAAEGKWGEAERMRKLMKRAGSRKEDGRSWIEVRNQVYSFVVGIRCENVSRQMIHTSITDCKGFHVEPRFQFGVRISWSASDLVHNCFETKIKVQSKEFIKQ